MNRPWTVDDRSSTVFGVGSAVHSGASALLLETVAHSACSTEPCTVLASGAVERERVG